MEGRPLRVSLSFFCLVVIVLLLVVGMLIPSSHAHPAPECAFSATSGFCSGMAGKGFLRGRNPEVLVLYLVNSDLSLLTADDFAPFHRLTTLHLNNCTLPPADRHPLATLGRLQALHLSFGGGLPQRELSAYVSDAKELRSLIMHHCGLRRVDAALVGQLPHLRTLDLRHNAVERVDAAALAALRELRLLRLEHNQLREAPALEETHAAVWLDGNPLCDARPPGGEDAFLEAACVPAEQRPSSFVEEDARKEQQEQGEATTARGRPEDLEEQIPEDQLLVRLRGPVRAGPPEDETSLWTVAAVGFGAGAACALVVSVVLVVVRRRKNAAAARTSPEDPERSSNDKEMVPLSSE